MNIKKFTFNPFQENSYVLYDNTKECIIIDPGCIDAEEQTELKQFIVSEGLKPVRLVNTHCHIDHILGNAFVNKTWGLGLEIHEKELFTLGLDEVSSKTWNIPYQKSPAPTAYLKEGNNLNFGNSTLKIVFTPGHAVGHVCFINEKDKFAVVGDVLFAGSIGRTDLPGGDFDTLIKSIKTELFPLADDMVIYSGHGPETTLGNEKLHNPFLK